MNLSIGEFGKAAQKLSRNPLGIIALFIALVYGIAALVLGVSSSSLQPNERMPLIYFLVFFPVIVLVAFYGLVANHHFKLYAPLDYQDKEGFFRALSPQEQKQKLEEEIKNIEGETKPGEQSQSLSPKDKDRSGKLTPETIEAYLEWEVRPHLPNAWIDESKTKTGYEINFTKYFYELKPLRSLAEIKADILALETSSLDLEKALLEE